MAQNINETDANLMKKIYLSWQLPATTVHRYVRITGTRYNIVLHILNKLGNIN